MQLQSTGVVLLIALVPDADRQFISVRVQLHPAGQEFYLPANINAGFAITVWRNATRSAGENSG